MNKLANKPFKAYETNSCGQITASASFQTKAETKAFILWRKKEHAYNRFYEMVEADEKGNEKTLKNGEMNKWH